MIAITVSTDWASKPVLQDMLQLLDDYNCRATIFCTDNLKESTFPKTKIQHELAIHPNYDDRNYKDETEVCIRNFPHAKGSRSHRLMHGTPILNELNKNHIKYDSSVLTYAYGFPPYMLHNGMVEIPIYFSDDVCVRNKDVEKFIQILNNALDNPTDLFVFNFHPIHTFLNTISENHYIESKRHYHDVDRLSNHIIQYDFGVRNMFECLLIACSETELLIDINKAVRTTHEVR